MDTQGGILFSYTTVQGFSLGSKTPGGRANDSAKKPDAATSDTFSQFRALALQFGPKEALTSLVKQKEPNSNAQDTANPSQHAKDKEQREGKQEQGDGSQINGGDMQPTGPAQPPMLESSVEYFQVEAAEPSAAQAAAAVATTEAPSQEDIEALGRRPYWMARCRNIRSPFLRLHQEMVELSELLQPAPEEIENRRSAVQEISEVVTGIWPSARVEVFGSFATGLYVPTSDIDLVVMDSRCTNIQDGLKAIASALVRRQLATKIQVIGKARVPIIKFETTGYGGIAFDVSFDVANGPQAAELVREFVDMWPMMRPLVLVLKLFLQQRELNEVYTGGIGSYALITLVSAFLQLHISRRPRDAGSSTSSKAGGKKGSSKKGQQPVKAKYLEPSLGVLLVDFFRFFGRIINMQQAGLSCADGGHFFNKVDKEWVNDERPFMLAVEDPKDPTNDICRSSYNIMRVRQAFDFAYQQLTAPCDPSESRLARILRLGPILVSRKPCPDPTRLYQALESVRAVPRPTSEAVKNLPKSEAQEGSQTPQEPSKQQQQGGGLQQGSGEDKASKAGTKRGRTESPAFEPPTKHQRQEQQPAPGTGQGKASGQQQQQQGRGQSRDPQQGQAQGSPQRGKQVSTKQERSTPAPAQSSPAAAQEEEPGDEAEGQDGDEGEEEGDMMELVIMDDSEEEGQGGHGEEEGDEDGDGDPSAETGGAGEGEEEDGEEGSSGEGDEDGGSAPPESREGSQPQAGFGQGVSRSARKRARRRLLREQQQQQQQGQAMDAGKEPKQPGKKMRGVRAGKATQAKKQQQLGVQRKPMKGGGHGRKEGNQ